MRLTKFAGLFLATSMFYPLVATAQEPVCDEVCKESIENQKELDRKDMDIMMLKKDMEYQRLINELNELKGQKNDQTEGMDDKIVEKIERVRSELLSRIEKISIDKPSIDDSSKSDKYDAVENKDTKGIENVYVTSTTSIGGDWSASIYYDNSIQNLSVGEEVFSGASIISIDRRGAIVKYNGGRYIKRVTPSEIAMARTFHNISEESKVRFMKLTEQEGSNNGYMY